MDKRAWRATVHGVTESESHTTEWLTHTHPESRKMGRMDLFAGQEWRHRCREQTCGHGGERRGWDEVRAQH